MIQFCILTLIIITRKKIKNTKVIISMAIFFMIKEKIDIIKKNSYTFFLSIVIIMIITVKKHLP